MHPKVKTLVLLIIAVVIALVVSHSRSAFGL
jgi:hypothetical protein